jgi:hypothetical protein
VAFGMFEGNIDRWCGRRVIHNADYRLPDEFLASTRLGLTPCSSPDG